MKEIKIEEQKKILIELLKYIDNICEENNIKYTLVGGSLIGAVRHSGIIPWDDDVDIGLLKDDYEKLIKILLNNNNGRYQLMYNGNNKSYYYPFPKLIDTKTLVKENNNKEVYNYGVFLDIFRYDNAPSKNSLQKIHYNLIQFSRQLVFGYANEGGFRNNNHKALKILRNIIAKILGKKLIIYIFNKITTRYNKKESEYVVLNWPNYGYKKEYQKKEYFKEFEKVQFDGIQAMIATNYDEILSTTFGDYMTPPPVEKRGIQHSMKAYWKD